MGELIDGRFSNSRIVVETQYSGGDGGDGMETRIAKLESDVDNIKTTLVRIWDDLRDFRTGFNRDIRILLAALISSTLGLAWIMAKGFGWL